VTRFVKAHACGNDFLIVEKSWAQGEDERDLAMRLCQRNSGVGADGVEFLEWSGSNSGRIRLYNADGSIAEISGNGTRCVAAWMAHEMGEPKLCITTDAGERVCEVISAEGKRFAIRSRMGVPTIAQHTVHLADGLHIDGAKVSVGNPHFVFRVDNQDFNVAGRDWRSVGRQICFHPDFPEQTNVEFLRVLSPDEIEIRIFERGVGPTTSSGTGTCASATAAIALYSAHWMLNVRAAGGAQRVEWNGAGEEMLLTGPAELICTGEAF
jgi:diaminopimelate epimerase